MAPRHRGETLTPAVGARMRWRPKREAGGGWGVPDMLEVVDCFRYDRNVEMQLDLSKGVLTWRVR
jgi:hypothetical protein